MHRLSLKSLVLCALALPLAGCLETPEQNAAAAAAMVMVGTSADPLSQRDVAMTALPNVLRGKRASRFTDAQNYMQAITDRIANANDLDEFDWQVYLIADRAPNASTLGGGVIFVNEGMLRFTPNEADIAIILAHEMAHSTKADAVNTQRTNAGVALAMVLASEALKRNGQGGNKMADALLKGGAAVALGQASQGREARADRAGFQYYTRAGYRPSAAPEIFNTLARLRGSGGGFGQVFASHPSPSKRADALRALAGKQPNRDTGRLNTTRWSSVSAPVRASFKKK